MSLTCYARAGDLTRLGEVDDFDSLTIKPRHNELGAWLITLDGNSDDAGLLTNSNGLVMVRDGVPLMSGPIAQRRYTLQDGRAKLEVAGLDDNVWLRRRLALPVVTGPPYTAQAYDKRTGVAETVMRQYVDVNAGPGAVAARRVPGLSLAPDLGRGANVVGSARFHVLLELLQGLAAAGGLGFRVVQVGAGLQFQVFVPADRTATAVFSVGLGNLAGYDFGLTSEEGTYGYVAGQGSGTARTIVEGAAAISPYRAEVFKDQRDTDDPTALAQSLTDTLAEGAAQTALALTPVETDAVQFGRDYNLGDRVTVVVAGQPIQNVVREVTVTYDKDGEQLLPVVGTPGAQAPEVPELFRLLDRQARRVGTLERS